MPLMARQSVEVPAWLGWIFVVVGLLIVAVATGIIPSDPTKFHAPKWLVGLIGGMFSLAGVKLITYHRPEISRWTMPVLVAGFAVVGLWVGLFGEAAAFSGGIGFLSPEANVLLARCFFAGFGGLLLIVLSTMLYNWRTLR
jgi:hypothetical protein